jgi:bifunctional non-homologous end joining protein LigD
MLATLVDKPFQKANWHFEEKYDGIRMLAYKEGSRVSLITRNGIERTQRFPAVAAAIAKLPPDTLLLDGEIVVFDAKRVSRFQLLQQSKGTPQYAVFDCLYIDGRDLRKEPLKLRRERLAQVIRDAPQLLLSSIVATDGVKAFQIASRRQLEGVVGKNLDSTYVERRSRDWLKVKVHAEEEFVIGGFTAPAGSRNYFGALLLGIYSGKRLEYVGKVGTGFNKQLLPKLYSKFKPLIRQKSAFAEDVRERDATFLAPRLVAQISFTEWTKDGKLRHPVFVGLREDKAATEVRWGGDRVAVSNETNKPRFLGFAEYKRKNRSSL